jgi:hypothetical protein
LNINFQLATHVHAEFQLSHFSRKFQSFLGKLLSEFQKIPNLSIHFYFSISNACECRISTLFLHSDRRRQIFDLFSRKFQSFSGKLLSEFQKIPYLNIHIYFSIAAHVHAEFQLSTCFSDRLRQIIDHFSRKFQSFSENS